MRVLLVLNRPKNILVCYEVRQINILRIDQAVPSGKRTNFYLDRGIVAGLRNRPIAIILNDDIKSWRAYGKYYIYLLLPKRHDSKRNTFF